MKKVSFLLAVYTLSIVLLHHSAHAQTNTLAKDPYYQISKVHTQATLSQPTENNAESLVQAHSNFAAQVDEFSDFSYDGLLDSGPLDIAELFVDAWQLVQDNKPVVNLQHQNASALPNIAKNNWAALTGWKPERQLTYHLTVENGYGMTVIDMTYQINLLYGGSYQNKGHYIASAQVIPTNVKVLWGFSLDMTASAPTVINVGTKGDPLAQISLNVSYQLKSLFKNTTTTLVYVVQGDGLLKDQTNSKVYYPADVRSK